MVQFGVVLALPRPCASTFNHYGLCPGLSRSLAKSPIDGPGCRYFCGPQNRSALPAVTS